MPRPKEVAGGADMQVWVETYAGHGGVEMPRRFRLGGREIEVIENRMPLILPKSAYERWLDEEPDPHELLTPFAADLMVMWPVSTRVNSPDNDDSSLLNPARELTAWDQLPPSSE
jgi:SOS response associated peptidase (SRAP)